MTTFTTEDRLQASRDTLQQVETKAILELFEAMKALELQLSIANARIRELESQIYGGSVK